MMSIQKFVSPTTYYSEYLHYMYYVHFYILKFPINPWKSTTLIILNKAFPYEGDEQFCRTSWVFT